VSAKVAESTDSVEGVTHEQQRPSLSDDLQRSSDGATLGGVFTGQGHHQILPLQVR
jgi:hypothetical protein